MPAVAGLLKPDAGAPTRLFRNELHIPAFFFLEPEKNPLRGRIYGSLISEVLVPEYQCTSAPLPRPFSVES